MSKFTLGLVVAVKGKRAIVADWTRTQVCLIAPRSAREIWIDSARCTPLPNYGFCIERECTGFEDKKFFLYRAVAAGVVRCISPERTGLCDSPAVRIYWQDQAEWYPCCAEHFPYGAEMWSGHTRGWNRSASLPVLPSAIEWIDVLPEDERRRICYWTYERYGEDDE